MTRFNNNRFTPGNKGNLRYIINKAYILQYYNINNNSDCGCIPQKANLTKQGWNNPSQTENTRISKILTGTLGGKITYGNSYKPVNINYLGGHEGQPGGTPRPLRNKF